MTIVMDAEALNSFLRQDFSQIGDGYRVDSVTGDELVARMSVGDSHLRPGGTISGPTIFSLADLAVYCAVLARIGPVALAVTTNASIDFMRKPEAGRDLIARCRLLKLGRVLAVADTLVFSEGDDRPVARSSMTYSIPPK